MWYEVKFGLIGFVVGTVAISATAISSDIGKRPSPVTAHAQPPLEQLALLPTPKPPVVAETKAPVAQKTAAPDKPMSAWRRAYIAKHGHQPPVPAS